MRKWKGKGNIIKETSSFVKKIMKMAPKVNRWWEKRWDAATLEWEFQSCEMRKKCQKRNLPRFPPEGKTKPNQTKHPRRQFKTHSNCFPSKIAEETKITIQKAISKVSNNKFRLASRWNLRKHSFFLSLPCILPYSFFATNPTGEGDLLATAC